MDSTEILNEVRKKMTADGVSQRELAGTLGISQGHLSRILRSQDVKKSRVMSILESWLMDGRHETRARNDAELGLLRSARAASGGEEEVICLLAEVIQEVSKAFKSKRNAL